MRENQLFLRDLIGVVVGISLITTVALLLAPDSTAPHQPPTMAAAQAALPPSEARGARLFESKGCVGCHSVDGTARVGPSLQHAFGTEVALADGSRVAFDEAYVRESVLIPRARSRPGYPATMPSFEGVVAPRDLDAIVAYVRSLQ